MRLFSGILGGVKATVILPDAVDQTVAFGALTLAGAGGFQLVNQNGSALTGVTDDGTGTASGYNLSAGGIITPSTDGSLSAQDGNTIDFSSDQGSGTATFSITASLYDFRSTAELSAIDTAGALAGGWTARGRRNVTITTAGERFFKNNTYTSRITLTGETGFAVKPRLEFETVENLTVSGFEVEDTAGSSSTGSMVTFRGGCSGIIVEDMNIHALFYDPLGDYSASGSYTNPNGIGSAAIAGVVPKGLTARRNEIYDVRLGLSYSSEGADGVTIEDNEIHHVYEDGAKLRITGSGLTAGVTIQRNIFRMLLGDPADADNPHVDIIQFISNADNHLLDLTNVAIRQNFAWEQAEARGRSVQGITAFEDGTDRVILKDAIVAGNLMALSGNHHINFQSADGGMFTHNTLTHPSATWDTTGQPNVKVGNKSSAGTITVRSNIHESANVLEGIATYSTSNNLDIGLFGATHAYGTVFDGASLGPTSWTEIKSKFPRADNGPADRAPLAATNIEDTGALGSGYQTVADVRDSTGWSFDATYEA